MPNNVMWAPALHGYVLMLSLIVAIGAQNAYLLAHAVAHRHHVLIVALCILIDAVMVGVGLAGASGLMLGNAWLGDALALAGACFLLGYGCRALVSVLRPGHLEAVSMLARSGREALVGTLAVSLLNPHVYLDTLVLIGGVGTRYPAASRWMFGVGAVCGSATWFCLLGLGGHCLAPILTRPGVWRLLNALIGCTMCVIAALLLRQLF